MKLLNYQINRSRGRLSTSNTVKASPCALKFKQTALRVYRQFDWLTSAPKGKEFNNPETWEGTWSINGQYWSHAADEQPTLTDHHARHR